MSLCLGNAPSLQPYQPVPGPCHRDGTGNVRRGCRPQEVVLEEVNRYFSLHRRSGLEIIGVVKPRVSVVIPTRNTRDMTLAAVGSLHEQSKLPAEIIVVDDGSSDGTLEAISVSFPDVKHLRIPESVGFTSAVNKGISASNGELILLLNSDAVASPNTVELLIFEFDRDAKLGIAGATLSFPDGKRQWSGGRFPSYLWLFGQASGLPETLGRMAMWRRLKPISGTGATDVDWVSGAAMALRRQAWDDVGPFHDAYHFYCQDLDLCWRAEKRGWKITVLPDVHVIHHLGGTIRSTRDAVGSAHATHLWRDFVRFFVIHRGARAGTRAARSIQIGGWFRLFSRRILTPFIPRSGLSRWQADTKSFSKALQEIARSASAQTERRS